MFAIANGIIIGIAIEKMSLLTGKWEYNGLMPIIPLINVGLVPVLQLILLPIGTLFIARNKL